MKKTTLTIAIVWAVGCLLVSGCTRQVELYYDTSEYAVEIKGYGVNYADSIDSVTCCVVFDELKLRDYVGWRIVAIKIFE